MLHTEATIMLIDDSGFSRVLLINLLKELGYTKFIEAQSVADARRRLEGDQVQIDLVISDIHMPNETGIDFLAWIRAHARLSKMPVLMMTAAQDQAEILAIGQLGVSGILIKPITTKMLRERFARL